MNIPIASPIPPYHFVELYTLSTQNRGELRLQQWLVWYLTHIILDLEGNIYQGETKLVKSQKKHVYYCWRHIIRARCSKLLQALKRDYWQLWVLIVTGDSFVFSEGPLADSYSRMDFWQLWFLIVICVSFVFSAGPLTILCSNRGIWQFCVLIANVDSFLF